MKKIYLIALLVIIGLGGLYAMLSHNTRNHEIVAQAKVQEIALQASENVLLKQPNTITNCCALEDSMILGTWIAVDDTLSKWVFKEDGICYEYYADTLSDKDRYRITNEKTLCGYDLSAGDPENRYMVWENVKNRDDIMCFSIGGLSDEVLTVLLFGSGEFLIFKRPWSNFEL